jgi:hypothetical protein
MISAYPDFLDDGTLGKRNRGEVLGPCVLAGGSHLVPRGSLVRGVVRGIGENGAPWTRDHAAICEALRVIGAVEM